MPQMGVSVSEGTITKWLKQVGEPIGRDEPLLEISTDKVDTEVPSPAEGVVAQILVAEGETVEVGTVLATIAPAGSAVSEPVGTSTPEPEPEPRPEPESVTTATPPALIAPEQPPVTAQEPPRLATPQSPVRASMPEREVTRTPAPSGNGRTFVSPVVARIAAEHGVDPAVVPGTGTGGRVTKKDILAYLQSSTLAAAAAPEPVAASVTPEPAVAPVTAEPEPEQVAPEPAPVAATAPPVAPAPAPAAQPPLSIPAAPTTAPATAQPAALVPGEALEPMTAMRRGIAEHMRHSLDTSAHVTSGIEVDMSRVVALRRKLKPEYEADHGVNVTYLSFIARAAVETLRDYPWINGEIRGEQIVTRNYVNLGFAVELADGKGLIVPVLRNAETLNLLGIAKGVADIAQRAREKKLLPDEVQGGTFTITNPGGYGTFHGTPVINQPQSAILGTYALVKRPWVVQDEH